MTAEEVNEAIRFASLPNVDELKSDQEEHLRQDVMALLPRGLFTAHTISGELH